MNERRGKTIRKIIPIALTVLLVGGFYLVCGCPVRFFTGVSCPGCGMSRACLACLRLDFAEAFRFHPLVFLLPVAAALLLWQRKNRRARTAILLACCAALVAVWVLRMFQPGDIVCFRPWEGAVYRAVRGVLRLILRK